MDFFWPSAQVDWFFFLEDKLSPVTSGFHPGTETFSFPTDGAYLFLKRKTSVAQWPCFSADDGERYSRRAWGLESHLGLHYSSNVWLTKKKTCALRTAVWLPYSAKASERWDTWTAHQVPQATDTYDYFSALHLIEEACISDYSARGLRVRFVRLGCYCFKL